MKWLLIMLLALCCTACTALPAEERAFAVALCVEKQGGDWQVHARIPTYKTGGEYLTVSGKGTDLTLALADMNASAPMQTAMSQLRLLVLSNQLTPGDLSELRGVLAARYELRQQCALAVTDASGKAVADALKPDTGARLSKALDVLLEARMAQGIVPRTTLADVLRMGERQSPVLMRLSLKERKPDFSGAYPLDAAGRILLPLDAEESALLALLLGDVKECSLSLDGESAALRDVCVKVVLKEDLRAARVTLTGRIVSSDITREALEQTVAERCVKLLSRLSGDRCDVMGLGRQAVLHVRDMAAWHDLNWQKRLPDIRWEAAVQFDPPA